MSDLVDASRLEEIVGASRHVADHIGRAVSSEQTVYILHSERCKAKYADLRECPYSLALDRGIDTTEWADFQDQSVKLWIRVKTLRLMPARIDTSVHPARALGGEPTHQPNEQEQER